MNSLKEGKLADAPGGVYPDYISLPNLHGWTILVLYSIHNRLSQSGYLVPLIYIHLSESVFGELGIWTQRRYTN